MNETVLDTFSALDATSQLTTITHYDGFNVNDYVTGTQLQAVLDTAAFSDATTDEKAHYVTDTAEFTDTVSSVRYVAQAVAEVFKALDTAAGGRYELHTETDVFTASDAVAHGSAQVVLEAFALTSFVEQTAVAVDAVVDPLQITSTARDGGTAIVWDTFQANDVVTEFIASVQLVTDTFAINDAMNDAPLLTDVVTDTFDAADAASATVEMVSTLSDTFHIYSRATSTGSTVTGTKTAGWMANTLGMAMTRMVGQFPTCRAGGYAGGKTGLHNMGTAPATVDTGSVRMSKGSDRVRISNVYCDGQLGNAFLAVTAENDLRASQTYSYDYRGRAGISNGRFDTGKGLTCQRMRMVLTADSLQLNRLQVVGGVSNRRL